MKYKNELGFGNGATLLNGDWTQKDLIAWCGYIQNHDVIDMELDKLVEELKTAARRAFGDHVTHGRSPFINGYIARYLTTNGFRFELIEDNDGTRLPVPDFRIRLFDV